MRSSTLFALLAVSAAGAVACGESRTLTGPEAQRTYAQVASDTRVVPSGALVFVDGKRLPDGTKLDQLDPKRITRIEIVKGRAAVGVYGEEGRAGVICIFTRGAQADSTGRQ
jgi:outer membrane receptor for ferrienterochelin and colicin